MGICCLNLEKGSSDAWFGLGYAMALGKPFVAAIDEVTETFTVTPEGIAWLKRFEEAREPASDNPATGRSSLLFFADSSTTP